ncbi:hypothetical protein [Pseudarthrobacter sp. MM222]|uniref:hypothetical protein n=1 Tax=Pseudarthrobacter sp. MM222 TaxID=3018929 RepID=UPI00222127AF|nr:hypothetical protein [Pseudarthrobacter sp. MM222]CAI3800608.1 hypothetical protein NKCBBBOE_02630 [Pseudarthrobacter sp. MM222]
MNLEIRLQFFQAAATVLPSIFIAFALTSHFLDPVSRRNLKVQFVGLSGRTGVVSVAIMITGFIGAELLTLIVLATDTPTFPAFVVVIFYVFLFAWFVGIQALNPMFQAAAAAAEEAAPDEKAKAQVIRAYRRFGNAIIMGSLVFLAGAAVVLYALRAG